MHYDWGLRAVKSLLRQARKRAVRSVSKAKAQLRGGVFEGQGAGQRRERGPLQGPARLQPAQDHHAGGSCCGRGSWVKDRTCSSQDLPIFQRLIQDLFPGVKAKPFLDPKFRKVCEDTVKARGLQPDGGFLDKVVDFLDILKVRHCCFIIGPTGAGKTEIWRSLEMALIAIGEDCKWEQVNPKAITADELYGTIEKGEWKDGAVSVIMRNMSKEMNGYKASHLHKWVVLDGDIDATWIESMNTVMDDNKVLTLVSNERIPFTQTMRMLLEIQDMKHASPATVSRGGVLYINESDVGWKPFVESWRVAGLKCGEGCRDRLLATACEERGRERERERVAILAQVDPPLSFGGRLRPAL
ncbi:ODA4 [Symbiodinium necroappetens]|uniref:ODA4 protein n=1 Tax=Symbiodinium necroappetens TaxID=1628268 RepID=A0A812NU92_9DINO|nr:ODA4 [Symbiodinium necroappetens]